MPDFIDLPITTDPSQIAQTGIDQLASLLQTNGYPGYVPNDGNLEIILLQVIASMAADAAGIAAQVPAAIFRAYGTSLLAVAYNQGAAATVTSTWTLADTAGHTIEAGTYVTLNAPSEPSGVLGFYVLADVVVSAGSSTASVTLVAIENGTAFNNLSGTVQPVDEVDWVTSVVTVGVTSGGADAEDDTEYANRLAEQLSLQAPRPITASDYAGMALSAPSSILPSGVVVGRATAQDGYNPASAVFTVTTVSGSPNLTITTAPGTGVLPVVGAPISGTGIPGATTVISAVGSTIVMSANASASNSGVTATIAAHTSTVDGGTVGNARSVGVFVADPSGLALSSAAMTAIQTWLLGFREINFIVNVLAPLYTTVYVTTQIHVLPGYTPASVATEVQSTLVSYLSPTTWGQPLPSQGTTSSATSWFNAGDGFQFVRYNKVLAVIEQVPGVDYVFTGPTGLALGLAPGPSGTSDVLLAGQAPLPLSTVSTVTVTTA